MVACCRCGACPPALQDGSRRRSSRLPFPTVRQVELTAMGYIVNHWSFDPFLIVVAALVAWHEIGLARLARRSRPERTRQRRRRSFLFYRGVARPLLSGPSPPRFLVGGDFFFS